MKILKPFAILLLSVFVLSCSDSDDPQPQLPTVTTAEINGVANTTAGAGGTVTDDGGNAVTERGVCWSIAENPTTADDKTSDGSGTGSFLSNITGLTANTTYYLRAYATNSAGTAYGNQLSFTTTNVPAPGTTVQYIVDIITIDGERIYKASIHNNCQEGNYAEFDMDPYAVSYTVLFYDMSRSMEGQPTTYPDDITYSFDKDAGVEIILAGHNDGNYSYITNWYSMGPGAVTRDTPAHKLYCNVSWRVGEGVCNNPGYIITGKARITVHY